MPDEALLRQRARQALQTGKLPSRPPDRTWGGPGVGAPSSVCNEPVTRDQLEFEIQVAYDGDTPGLDKFHVHLWCFAAFEMSARSSRTPDEPPATPGWVPPHVVLGGGTNVGDLTASRVRAPSGSVDASPRRA